MCPAATTYKRLTMSVSTSICNSSSNYHQKLGGYSYFCVKMLWLESPKVPYMLQSYHTHPIPEYSLGTCGGVVAQRAEISLIQRG